MWAKFNCAGGDAFAKKQIALPAEYWFQADFQPEQSTFTACDDHNLRNFSALFMAVLDTTTHNERDAATLVRSLGTWKWATDNFGAGGVALAAFDTPYTIKAHVNGTAVTWFVNGVAFQGPHTITSPHGGVQIGGFFSEGCACEVYWLTNVKVGTTDGGSDLFADDFSSGDFSNWTSTTGTCAVAGAPAPCVTPTVTPASGCRGARVSISATGWAPDSPLTLTGPSGAVAFSQATVDGSGNVAGTFLIPDGLPACATCSYTFTLTDAGGDTFSFDLIVCCQTSDDGLDTSGGASSQLVGPSVATGIGTPWDSIHHDGATWFVFTDDSQSFANHGTLPPPPNHTLTVVSVSDDGLTVNTYAVDTDYAWAFNWTFFATTGGGNWFACLWFDGWDKPVYDAKFGTDGDTLWLTVVTRETVLYPNITSDDGHDGYQSQADQFIDLATLTSGYSSFPRSCGDSGETTWNPGDPPTSPFARVYHDSIGLLDFYEPDFPNSDGGDSWFGYWNPPKVVVFAGGAGGFTRIGDVPAKYCPGNVANLGGDGPFTGGPTPPRRNACPNNLPGAIFTGVAVAASPAEPGVCHVVWGEGGAWGRMGAGALHAAVADVWDAGPANIDYRMNYSAWSAGGQTDDVDLSHVHIDRTSYFFPYAYNFHVDAETTIFNVGYTWPVAPDEMVVTPLIGARNEHGAPVLFLVDLLTTLGHDPHGAFVDDGQGNPWLDNVPDYAAAAVRMLALPGGGELQVLPAGLLPNATDVSRGYPGTPGSNRFNVPVGVDGNGIPNTWGEFERRFALSALYDDPSAGDVYLVGAPWLTVEYDANRELASGYPKGNATAFYRVPADGGGAFEFIDGGPPTVPRYAYCICVAGISGDPQPPSAGDFFSDTRQAWFPSGAGTIWQLDRICQRKWVPARECPSFLFGFQLGRFTEQNTGIYYDPATDRFSFLAFDGLGGQVVRYHINRHCIDCSCGSIGLHISKRISLSGND